MAITHTAITLPLSYLLAWFLDTFTKQDVQSRFIPSLSGQLAYLILAIDLRLVWLVNITGFGYCDYPSDIESFT